MKPCRLVLGPAGLFFLCLSTITAATLTIPAVTGTLTIDGRLDDAAWKNSRVLGLASADAVISNVPPGETRLAVRGDYVCLSARIPEKGRVVARSKGKNPTFWREDMVVWTFRVHSNGRNVTLALAVNPLGAYRLEDPVTRQASDLAGRVILSARLTADEWSVEAAVPVSMLADIGLISIERVRVPRPDVPELQWYWPGPNERMDFQIAARGSAAAPAYAPPQVAMARSERSPAATARPGLQGLASIPKTVWGEGERKQHQAALRKLARSRVAEAAENEKLAWQKVNTRQDWERFREPRLRALRDSLAPFPERTPLRAAVTRRSNYGEGFVIENLVFESRPGLVVTANMYVPEKPSGRIPAIVVVHSHHAPKIQAELQDMGMTWARAGAAVLVMDQICAGERLQSQPWSREGYYGRYALGMQLHLAGESLMKWMVWDLMRSIDLLLERPYIDPKRIVMLGAVAGGGDPAAVTAALDPRIAAVIPFNFGEAGPEEHYTEGPRPYPFDTADPGWGSWETTRNLDRSIADQFFPWFICASVAPRPFLFAFEMGWPATVEQEPAWARYKKVYELNGARERLDEVQGFGPFPGPGECTNVGALHRKRIYPILKKWLDVPVPPFEYRSLRPDAELMCLTPAISAERNPQPASRIAHALASKALETSRSRLASLTPETRRIELRAALARLLGDTEPPKQASARAVWSKQFPQSSVEAVAIESEPGIQLPVFILKPASKADGRRPAVMAVAQGGKERFLTERMAEISELLKAGTTVCLPDVRGDGELASTPNRGPGAMSLAALEFMFGKTLLGARLKDTRTVMSYLAARPDIDSTRIAMWGDSFASVNPQDLQFSQSPQQEPGPYSQHQAEPMGGLLAVLTALYDDRVSAVAVRRGLLSYVSVLEDRFCHVPQDAIVPGVLQVADIPDVIGALSPRPVLLEGLVDGLNRVVRLSGIPGGTKAALAGDSKDASRILLRGGETQAGVAEWLSGHLGAGKTAK